MLFMQASAISHFEENHQHLLSNDRLATGISVTGHLQTAARGKLENILILN